MRFTVELFRVGVRERLITSRPPWCGSHTTNKTHDHGCGSLKKTERHNDHNTRSTPKVQYFRSTLPAAGAAGTKLDDFGVRCWACRYAFITLGTGGPDIILHMLLVATNSPSATAHPHTSMELLYISKVLAYQVFTAIPRN